MIFLDIYEYINIYEYNLFVYNSHACFYDIPIKNKYYLCKFAYIKQDNVIFTHNVWEYLFKLYTYFEKYIVYSNKKYIYIRFMSKTRYNYFNEYAGN